MNSAVETVPVRPDLSIWRKALLQWLFPLTAALYLAPAHAADWVLVYQDPDSHQIVETDIASIDHRKDIALAWERVSFSTDQSDSAGRVYRSRIELWAYQCAAQRLALMQFTEYSGESGQGEAVSVVDFTPDYHWTFATRDSVGAKTLKFACNPSVTKSGKETRTSLTDVKNNSRRQHRGVN